MTDEHDSDWEDGEEFPSAGVSVGRRLMGLGRRPDPSAMRTSPAGDGLSRLLFPSEQEADRAWKAWHAERGARVAVADVIDEQVLRRLRRLRHDPHLAADRLQAAVIGPLRRRRVRHGLRDAAELRFTSWHLHRTDATTDVEGWLSFGPGARDGIAVTIYAADALGAYAVSEWQSGNILRADELPFGSPVTLLAPVACLTPEVCHLVLERWYAEEAEYDRGHPACRTGRLPRIIVDLAFSEDHSHPRRVPGAGEKAERILYMLDNAAPEHARRTTRRFSR